MTDLPPSWASAQLSDLGPWIGGGTPSKANPAYWNGPIPWVSPKDMKTQVIRETVDGITTEAIERSSAKLVPPEAVLIVTRSGILAHSLPVAVTAVESSLNQDLKALNPPSGIVPDYIAWGLRACEQRILDTCRKGGTTVHSIEMPRLSTFEIPVAPTNEQHRIVDRIEALFDEIDSGVESLRDVKRTIELYRQSLLKSAFEGRLTADWRAENPDKLESPDALFARIREERETRYSIALEDWERSVAEWRKGSENGRRPAKPKRPVRPEKCEVDGLRELPEGWFYLAFDALAQSIRNGISVKPDEIGPLKIFRISAVRPMAFDLNDFRHITDPDGSMENFRLKYGDLIFTRYNGSRDYVGVSAMYRGDGTHVYPDKLIRCQIDSEIINAAYLEAATNCGESRSHVEGRIRTTAGQSGVSGNDIKTIPVPNLLPRRTSRNRSHP